MVNFSKDGQRPDISLYPITPNSLKLPLDISIKLNPSSGSEWFTPLEIIEKVRQVLAIGLDPASCPVAQQIVHAESIYSAQDNALSKRWFGDVWFNPPYLMPLIEEFTAWLVHNYQGGGVKAALCLVNAATDTAWFHSLARTCIRRLDFKGRLSFWNPSKPGGSNHNGQVVSYFGHSPELFELSFAHHGLIYGSPLVFKRGVMA